MVRVLFSLPYHGKMFTFSWTDDSRSSHWGTGSWNCYGEAGSNPESMMNVTMRKAERDAHKKLFKTASGLSTWLLSGQAEAKLGCCHGGQGQSRGKNSSRLIMNRFRDGAIQMPALQGTCLRALLFVTIKFIKIACPTFLINHTHTHHFNIFYKNNCKCHSMS